MTRREAVALLAAGPLAARSAGKHQFGIQGDRFALDGKPFTIRSGEMHYARVPREYWRDRMKQMRAMGLNTLCLYSFWNMHEPRPGQFDFSGNLDIAAFIRTAQEEGLWVIVRPGPYSCAEWEFGGFPSWLLETPDMKVRSTDPRFLAAARRYMSKLLGHVAPLQIGRGGPVILMQVENEYGSFGDDKVYLNAIRKMIVDSGIEVALDTSDGPNPKNLAGGTLPDVTSVINFGGDPKKEFPKFAKFRQGVPRMCGEYWVGWFDHWGEKHHTGDTKVHLAGIEWMLENNISFSLYMVHGGSTRGFMNGANVANAGKTYQPDISSYDYDAPIDEAGRPTAKFHLFRDAIKKSLPAGETLPELPAPGLMIEIPRFELNESAAMLAQLPKPVKSERPKTFEALHQDYGFVLYRTKPKKAENAKLELHELRDYAVAMEGTRRLGALDRRKAENTLEVTLDGAQPLDLLVENMGRINFGPELREDRKGITEKVTLGGDELTGWEMFSLPLRDLRGLKFSKGRAQGPSFYRGQFDLAEAGGVFLDLRGWGKGNVWVNGRNLGRYWKIGPQQTLFVPGAWLKRGANDVIVLDLFEGGTRSLSGLKDPVWETPA
jgi:beta-galactosidase